MKIGGTAYGRPASLEVAGDTVTWRARPDAAENIATTVHDIRFARFSTERASWPGIGCIGLGGIWILGDHYIVGAVAFAIALGLIGRRVAQPRRRLVLEVGANQLVMEVDAACAPDARALVDRIARAIESGELPSSPPTLP